MPTLSASSFVVLGMLDRYGPSTPYGLDRRIGGSIGNFWSFPRSQIYGEAARLVRLRLVDENHEPTGRRRRLLTITAAGTAALSTWLQEPSPQRTELHDGGLLRLFFVEHSADPAAALARLAEQQEQAHRARLAEYRAMVGIGGIREDSPQRATLELGIRYEQLVAEFWAEIRASPPATSGRGAAPRPAAHGRRP